MGKELSDHDKNFDTLLTPLKPHIFILVVQNLINACLLLVLMYSADGSYGKPAYRPKHIKWMRQQLSTILAPYCNDNYVRTVGGKITLGNLLGSTNTIESLTGIVALYTRQLVQDPL